MSLINNRYQLFTGLILYLVGLLVLGIILAIGGIFYNYIFIAYLILGIGCLIYITKLGETKAQNSSLLAIIVLLSLIFIFALSYFTTPTIFSGRDQGSFSQAAIELANNHKLAFSSPASQEFYKIYGPGTALNFPGFDYAKGGELLTNFPLGYTVWLAIFYSLFGLNGLVIANAVTLFMFFILFFLISRSYFGPRFAFWTWLLAITSFSFSWFFKFTLSENLALFLFWLAVWELVLFIKNESKLHLFASLFTLLVLTTVRIEAWAFLFMFFIVLRIKYKNWKGIAEKLSDKKLTIPLVLTFVVLLFSIKINFPFYLTFARGFIKAFAPLGIASAASPYSFSSFSYLIKVLGLYTILNFVILGFLGVIYLLKNKHYEELVVAFLSAPILVYLINPSISTDHPWMLRRFVFVLLPAAILYSSIFLFRFFSKKIYTYLILVLLLAMNIIVSLPYFTSSENKNLLPQVKDLSQNFTAKDLILIDREASGSGWSMIAGPMSSLYNLQAVYFFNPQDLDKINKNQFDHIYFIIPDKNKDFYASSGLIDKLKNVKEYKLDTNMLDVRTGKKSEIYQESVNFPEESKLVVKGKIYELK